MGPPKIFITFELATKTPLILTACSQDKLISVSATLQQPDELEVDLNSVSRICILFLVLIALKIKSSATCAPIIQSIIN